MAIILNNKKMFSTHQVNQSRFAYDILFYSFGKMVKEMALEIDRLDPMITEDGVWEISLRYNTTPPEAQDETD